MNRRTFLTTSGLSTVLLLAGCLGTGDDDDENGDDNGNGENGNENGNDENGDNNGSGNGNSENGSDNGDDENGSDNGNGTTETIAYAELGEREQEFLDAVETTHEVQWIGVDGERKYIASTNGTWKPVDEPLVPAFLSDELEPLVEGDVYLERDGKTSRLIRYSGHDFYGARYGLTTEESCEGDPLSLNSFKGEKRELLDTLVEGGEMVVADPAYQEVAAADVFVEPESEQAQFLGETFIEDERCLELEGERVRVVGLGELQHETMGYMLEPVEN